MGQHILKNPTINHVQSYTMAFALLADPTRALQGTNQGSGPDMEESENGVVILEQLLLYAVEHYLAGKLPLGDHLGKVSGIVCGTIPTHTSARIFKRVTVGPQVVAARSFDPLTSWSSWSLQTRFSGRGLLLVSTTPTISNSTLLTIHLVSNTACLPACSYHPDEDASLKLP
ncbi:15-hydroxyprostaglandin dehydrogenase [Trichonephila clavipes]|nr:15-hydroxyprostaglandin dehydrogenase [Trichonephila clavipes]